MTEKIVAYALLAFCYASCNYTNNKSPENELNEIRVSTTEISSSSGEKLRVKSFFLNHCAVENASTTQVAVKKQELYFFRNGLQISHASNPIMAMTFIHADCTDSLEVLECSINEISILEGSIGTVFCIRGNGLYNASPELFAFYDIHGNCIWLNYSNKYRIYKSLGNYDSVCYQIGIDPSLWTNGHYKKANIEL